MREVREHSVTRAADGTKPSRARVAFVDHDVKLPASVREAFRRLAPEWELDYHGHDGTIPTHIVTVPPLVVFLAALTRPEYSMGRLQYLKALLPELPVIMNVATPDPRTIVGYLIAGASGCLIQPMEPDDIVKAARNVLAGNPVLCAQAQKAIIRCLQDFGATTRQVGFTPRERDIIACLVQGSTDKEIANALNIARNTVHVHVTRILTKLGVRTRKEAVFKAIGLPHKSFSEQRDLKSQCPVAVT